MTVSVWLHPAALNHSTIVGPPIPKSDRRCLIRIKVLPETRSGEHKVKILQVLVKARVRKRPLMTLD